MAIKAAVFGVGRMGRRHIQAARLAGLEVTAICDSSPASLDLAAAEEGVPSTLHYRDPERALKEAKPDCAIISTTAPAHCDLVCLAAELGVPHILCEKPMAVSLEQCDRMIRTCEERGARLAVNHQMRFMDRFTRPKELMADEAFGGLSSMTMVTGNMGLAMNGTHCFEAFRYLTDEEPAEVAAWFSSERVPNPRGAQFEDRAGSVRVWTGSGKRFFLDAGADQGHGVYTVYAGPYGRLAVDDVTGNLQRVVRQEEYRSLPTTRYGSPCTETTERIAPADAVEPTRAVLTALLDGSNYPSGADGRLAIRVLVAAYVSDEQAHRTVRLTEELPYQRVFPWA